MNTSKLNTKSLRNNDEVNNFDVLARLLPRNNGTQAGIDAMAASLKRGMQPDSYKEANNKLNDKCLQTPRNKELANILKSTLLIGILILGVSFASMAQSKPSPKTNIMVVSEGRKVTLTVADTCYLNNATYLKNTTLSAKAAIYNYRTGGVIKNNDVADLIFSLLKNRKS